MSNTVTLCLHDDALSVIDAIARDHGLRGRSEAVRHVCAALAQTYGCDPVQVIRANGRPPSRSTFERRKSLLSTEALRALPDGAVKDEWVAWYNTGVRPSSASADAVRPAWGDAAVDQMLRFSLEVRA